MSFKKDIERFNMAFEDKANKVFRGVGLSMLSRVVMRTPVGNPSNWKVKKAPKGYAGGRLKANWQAEINAPAKGEVSKIDANGGSTINKGFGKMAAANLGDSIYIVNNLPYAQAIENGHSRTQAPAGMVKVSVQEFVREVNKIARKVR
jgi:hypothetical protein